VAAVSVLFAATASAVVLAAARRGRARLCVEPQQPPPLPVEQSPAASAATRVQYEQMPPAPDDDDARYDVLPSETNFIFVNIRRPASEFRAGCRERGVGVGRDFPPMEQTHARISIGTMDEMQRACAVFEEVLA